MRSLNIITDSWESRLKKKKVDARGIKRWGEQARTTFSFHFLLSECSAFLFSFQNLCASLIPIIVSSCTWHVIPCAHQPRCFFFKFSELCLSTYLPRNKKQALEKDPRKLFPGLKEAVFKGETQGNGEWFWHFDRRKAHQVGLRWNVFPIFCIRDIPSVRGAGPQRPLMLLLDVRTRYSCNHNGYGLPRFIQVYCTIWEAEIEK